jgi:hypothetical protein
MFCMGALQCGAAPDSISRPPGSWHYLLQRCKRQCLRLSQEVNLARIRRPLSDRYRMASEYVIEEFTGEYVAQRFELT